MKTKRLAGIFAAVVCICSLVPAAARAMEAEITSGSLADFSAANPEVDTIIVTGEVDPDGFVLQSGMILVVKENGSLKGTLHINKKGAGTLTGFGAAGVKTAYVLPVPEGVRVYRASDMSLCGEWLEENFTGYAVGPDGIFRQMTGDTVGEALVYAIRVFRADGSAAEAAEGMPVSYYVMDSDQTIDAGPDLGEEAFGGWTCAGLSDSIVQSITIPAGTNQELLFTWYSKEEAEAVGDPGNGGFGGFGGGGMGGFGGGFSGMRSLSGMSGLTVGETEGVDESYAVEETAVAGAPASVSNIMMPGGGGNRIRSASPGIKRIIYDDGDYTEQQKNGEVSARWDLKRYAGFIAGGILLMAATIFAASKRAKAKKKATFEKLHIND